MVMVTPTVRHDLKCGVKSTREGVADTWQWVQRHRRWNDWAKENGLEGFVRNLDVTLGPNGPHPHLHNLLFFDHELCEDEKAALWLLLTELWGDGVHYEMGERYVPSVEHGVVVSEVNHDGRYLAKMGLAQELTGPGTKRAKDGNRTPWQLAWDVVNRAWPADVDLWRDYSEGMRGARALTWSRGLKERYGVEKRSAKERAQEDPAESWTFATLSLPEWHRVAGAGREGALVSAAVAKVQGDGAAWAALASELGLRCQAHVSPPVPPRVEGVLEVSFLDTS